MRERERLFARRQLQQVRRNALIREGQRAAMREEMLRLKDPSKPPQ
jgi:hypothetical protein